MVGPRVEETGEGIQEELQVGIYDAMMRRMRDKGWLETGLILASGITQGLALEVGSGPGYLGLEWLKKTSGASLKAVEISPAMIEVARRNAEEYGFGHRVEYVPGNAQKMPFDDQTFDGVFTNGSLHEWVEPKAVFNEMHRVLKPGGRYCISDLRRDMNPLVRWFMRTVTKPKEIRPGLLSSIRAAYVPDEIRSILEGSRLERFDLKRKPMGMVITGRKAG